MRRLTDVLPQTNFAAATGDAAATPAVIPTITPVANPATPTDSRGPARPPFCLPRSPSLPALSHATGNYTAHPAGTSDSFLPAGMKQSLAHWTVRGPATEAVLRREVVNRISSTFTQPTATLRLNNLALTELPDCLAQLEWVTELNVGCNDLKRLPALPRHLRKLWAANNRQQALPALPSGMQLLMADHNCLTQLPDLPASLTILQINDNQLTHLPRLPCTLRMLNIASNEIVELPENFESVMQAGYLDVSHNPLSRVTMQRLAMLPYSIDVVCLHDPWFYSAEKWSISSAAEQWQKPGTSPLHNLALGWDEMEDEPDAPTFARFLNRLKQTAEYEAPQLRPMLVERVTTLLTAVRKSPPLRQLCFAIASDSVKACADLVAMALNDMETARLVHAAENGSNPTADLHALGRGMFRLYVIDDIVVKNLEEWSAAYGCIDPVEVRMGYQTMLAERLHLPGMARGMKYPHSTMLVREDLETAETEVRSREQSDELTAFLADWAPWRLAMQRDYPAPFVQWQASIEVVREAIAIKPEAMSEQEWITAFKDLRQEEASQLHELTAALTRRWHVRASPSPPTPGSASGPVT